MMKSRLTRLLAGSALASLALSGCAGGSSGPQLPPASFVSLQEGPGEEYIIGPLDELTIFVWRNPELGAQIQVRPDGRITTPLITDMPAVGKTSSMLAQDVKLQLSQYIQDPIVSVIVNKFAGTFSQHRRGFPDGGHVGDQRRGDPAIGPDLDVGTQLGIAPDEDRQLVERADHVLLARAFLGRDERGGR